LGLKLPFMTQMTRSVRNYSVEPLTEVIGRSPNLFLK